MHCHSFEVRIDPLGLASQVAQDHFIPWRQTTRLSVDPEISPGHELVRQFLALMRFILQDGSMVKFTVWFVVWHLFLSVLPD